MASESCIRRAGGGNVPAPQPVPPLPGPDVPGIELPPDPKAEPVVAMPPPKPIEKPKEKKPKQKHAAVASAPSRAEQKADRAAAPLPGASSRNSNALPNWKTQLLARLERSKRYPSEARGDHGTAQLAFSVDRQGGVHNARITRSSGSSVLDHETLALVQRAQPLRRRNVGALAWTRSIASRQSPMPWRTTSRLSRWPSTRSSSHSRLRARTRDCWLPTASETAS